MIYKKYGEVFLKLRKQKGFNLISFERAGISKSSLGKFERGESMLGFDKLTTALQILSVTLGEYENFLNNFEIDAHEILIQKIITARVLDQAHKIPELYQEALEINEERLALALKGESSTLTFEELETLIDYFENIDMWRDIDLCTLYLSLDHLNAKEIAYILNQFLIDGHIIFNSLRHRTRFSHIAYHSVGILVSKGYKELAQHVMAHLDSHNLKQTMSVNNIRKLVEGFWIAKFEDNEKGQQQMDEALRHFDDLSDYKVAQYYKRIYHT
ncbi:transcriptional regulator [Bacilli bacterium]|nr:transcriptional regulator [Bacilli bacterium]GHU44766.1 transcriptional regulator [Bacilli bacterium]